MNDRELLELAAKAVGYRTDHKWNAERLELEPAVVAIVAYDGERLVSTAWNPLTNDGDALRLAVKLRLELAPECYAPGFIEVYFGDQNQIGEATLDDPMRAARRVIVRAAAEIGRAMP